MRSRVGSRNKGRSEGGRRGTHRWEISFGRLRRQAKFRRIVCSAGVGSGGPRRRARGLRDEYHKGLVNCLASRVERIERLGK